MQYFIYAHIFDSFFLHDNLWSENTSIHGHDLIHIHRPGEPTSPWLSSMMALDSPLGNNSGQIQASFLPLVCSI
jgi:hypothetical protein